MKRIAILGGTGPEGLGLGLRFALSGFDVVLGSREEARGAAAAEDARRRLEPWGGAARVQGTENARAVAGADLVVLAFPFAGVRGLLPGLAPLLRGRDVLDVVNPVVYRGGRFALETVPEGSAAEAIQRVLPESTVVSGFKNQSAEDLQRLDRPLAGDVLVCSDDRAARERICTLARRIPRLRALDAGGLANARYLEAITALLLNLNRQHRATTSIRILGIDED